MRGCYFRIHSRELSRYLSRIAARTRETHSSHKSDLALQRDKRENKPYSQGPRKTGSQHKFVPVANIVVQAFQDRATGALPTHSRLMVGVIAFSLFIDFLLYGIFFPLAAHSPAKLQNEEQFALLYGAYAVSVLLVTPVFGYLGDRIGGRVAMLYGLALAACAILLFGAASNFFVLLLARLFQGAASAAFWTSGLALIATHYSEKRVEMLGYAFAAGTLGSVLGPIVGGLLFHAGGYKLPYLVTGILVAIDAPLIVFLLPAKGITQGETLGIRGLLLNKSVAVAGLAVALAAFSVGVVEPLLPVRLARYGTTSMAIGFIFTISTLVYGLSAPIVGRVSERLPIQKVIVLGTIAMAATLPLLAVFKGTVLVCIALSLVNISFAFMLNPASAELGNAVDRAGMSCYSAAYGVYNICYSIGMLATAGLASTAARRLGFWGVMLCASAILLLSIPVLTRAGSPQRAVPAAPHG
jgi:MFS transporter, DHA1 family, solute carrier family 18 (vesicular amine transporter), member 1/2